MEGFLALLIFLAAMAVLTLGIYIFMWLIGYIFGLNMGFRWRRPTIKNKVWAYQTVGMYMLYAERDELPAQYQYFVSYLRRIFPNVEIDRSAIAEDYRLHPYSDDVAMWLGKHCSDSEKLILIELLVDLAFHNQHFSRKELGVIQHIGRLIGLEHSDIQPILRIRYEQKKRAENAKRQSEQRTTPHRQKSQKLVALQILGLPGNTVAIDEVRKAYRSLARKHHPDRFVRASEEEQKLAHERFAEISAAHDLLLEIL